MTETDRQQQSGQFGRLAQRLRDAESAFDAAVAMHGLRLLRYSLAVVFTWFGTLTALGHGTTPPLVATTFGVSAVGPLAIALGVLELTIGLCMLSRLTIRFGVVLVLLHATVTTLSLVAVTDVTFMGAPYAPSFEGVYIIKNWVLLGAAMTVGGAIGPRTN